MDGINGAMLLYQGYTCLTDWILSIDYNVLRPSEAFVNVSTCQREILDTSRV